MPKTPVNDRFILPGEQPSAAYVVEKAHISPSTDSFEQRSKNLDLEELFLHVAPAISTRTNARLLSQTARTIAEASEVRGISYSEAKQIVDLAGQWIEHHRSREARDEYGLVS